MILSIFKCLHWMTIEKILYNVYIRRMKYMVPLFLLLSGLSSCSYLPDEDDIASTLKAERADYALYYSGVSQPGKAFLMVPGGLVDPYVYACWIDRLVSADSTIAVVLVKYPSNLAILNIGKVMQVVEKTEDIQRWVIGGHSLGGTVAATVVNDHRNGFDGLILMGSWSREATDLSDWEGSVLSIYGSEDLVASEDEITGNSAYLPEGIQISTPNDLSFAPGQTFYYEIDGGNHSGFGCYGPQDGDGEALISSEEQQELMIAMIRSYLDVIW